MENFIKYPTTENNVAKVAMEKEAQTKKNAVLVKDKEWSSKCKCLDPECTNKANSPVPTVEEKEW